MIYTSENFKPTTSILNFAFELDLRKYLYVMDKLPPSSTRSFRKLKSDEPEQTTRMPTIFP